MALKIKMKTEPKWLSTNVAPEIIQDRDVLVKNKFGHETKARIVVQCSGGFLAVSAHYGSNPFEPSPTFFYLTQAQLDNYLVAPGTCVLNTPA